MIVPPLIWRREIDRNLSVFFHNHHRPSVFRRAISDLCRYYGVKQPRIKWFEYIDWGKTAGKTYEDGRIHLVHPESWKRGRVYRSERMWVQMIYHEMGHYLLWTDAERKADAFMRQMVIGLRRPQRRARTKPPRRREAGGVSRPGGGTRRRRSSNVTIRSRRRNARASDHAANQ